MKLIDNWKDGLKWFSTQAFIALATIPTVYYSLPADLQQQIPDNVKPAVLVLLALGGLAGRFIRQTPTEKD